MSVEAVHKELRFEHYAPQLKTIKNIWRQISVLQRAAQKDATQLAKYRAFLQTTISRMQKVDAANLDDEAAIEALTAFQQKYNQRRAALASVTRLRGARHLEDWIARWHPETAQAFTDAYLLALNEPNTVTLQRLREAADVYFKVYEST